jgi:hypothetical protein
LSSRRLRLGAHTTLRPWLTGLTFDRRLALVLIAIELGG